jgi:branched-chain amino acid transport system ATP-binding protein
VIEDRPQVLAISGLDCFYGEVQVLHGLDLVLHKGEVLCLFGRNGAGKTTTLKAIMGLVRSSAGSIRVGGKELTDLPAHEVPKAGVAYVPPVRRYDGGGKHRDRIDGARQGQGRA